MSLNLRPLTAKYSDSRINFYSIMRRRLCHVRSTIKPRYRRRLLQRPVFHYKPTSCTINRRYLQRRWCDSDAFEPGLTDYLVHICRLNPRGTADWIGALPALLRPSMHQLHSRNQDQDGRELFRINTYSCHFRQLVAAMARGNSVSLLLVGID